MIWRFSGALIRGVLVGVLTFSGVAPGQDEAAPASSSAQIQLADGSTIVGEIVGLDGGVLTIATSAADGGEIKVKFSEVVSITSSQAHTFVLDDGQQLKGAVTPQEGGLSIAGDATGPVPVPLGRIQAINPPPKRGVRHKGNIALNGRVTDGNSRTKSVGAVGEYEARSKRSRLTLRGDWNYAEDQGELSARNASGAMKYDLFVSDRVFLYSNALFEGDDFADLNLRTALGAGVGVQIFDGDDDDLPYSFYEEVGISFFDEDFDTLFPPVVPVVTDPDTRYAAARVSGKFDWDVVAGRAAFFHFHELFFGFEDQDDMNANTQSGIRLTIVENFYANAQINFKWDNTPAQGNRRTDTEYLWGLGYSFKF